MRTSLAISALVAVGAGAISASAATLPHFLGSDTLFDVTKDAITACGAATGLIYDGTGSGNGENAMAASPATQAIAPMSRFMGTNICAGPGVTPANLKTAQGVVIGLDGVAVVSAAATGGAGTCNGTNSTTCTPESAGLAFSTSVLTTVGTPYTYTFANWKDVLSVLYGGKSNANGATSDSGCNSNIRKTLVNSWGSLFQVPGNCTSCTSLRHAFRRDDASGTSDVFASLIGLSPSPTSASNRAFGTSAFCNVNEVGVASFVNGTSTITVTTTIPHGLGAAGATATITIVGAGKQIDGTSAITNGDTVANGNNMTATVVDGINFTIPKVAPAADVKVGSYAMVLLPPPPGLLNDPIPTDYRELDPIRIPCDTGPVYKEEVCNRDGNLGVVLPIVPTDFLPTLADQYPTTQCTGSFDAIAAALVKDPNTGLNRLVTCPSGEAPHSGNLCSFPTDPANNVNCANPPNNHPFVLDNTAIAGIVPGSDDARDFNAHLVTGNGGAGVYQVDSFGRPIVGAWYRIHERRVFAPGTTACTQKDATLQIGCLVQASPCSIGFAGKESSKWDSPATPTTVAMKVNQVLPLPACIQSFGYALSRKLYLDTIVGWPSVAGTAADGPKELGLGQCEATDSFITPILANRNFVRLPDGGAPNNGAPFAEDFNETMLCPTQTPPDAGANTVAYAANGSVTMPTVGTICGNGIKEAFEDCDDGTTGATAPPAPASYLPVNGGNNAGTSQCTNTCRWKNAFLGCDSAGTKDVGGAACVAGDEGTLCHTSAGFTPASAAGKCQNVGGPCCLP